MASCAGCQKTASVRQGSLILSKSYRVKGGEHTTCEGNEYVSQSNDEASDLVCFGEPKQVISDGRNGP